MKMLNIGLDISISKRYYSTALDALSIGTNLFQFFTRNSRCGRVKEFDMELYR